uniref:Uncharacterized protein n=1 Tax=viral metagenome TaxID=1070528 RepID=A0A6C0EJW3_9ZZZZ
MTLINVVHLGKSFNRLAPTYVQLERIPPRKLRILSSTGPLYGILTVLPSDDRYLATPPWYLSIAVSVGDVFKAKSIEDIGTSKVINMTTQKGKSAADFDVDRYYEILTLPDGTETFTEIGADVDEVGHIFKYKAPTDDTTRGGSGTVVDVTYNKGGFFIMENASSYIFDSEGTNGDVQNPAISDWSKSLKKPTDGTSGGWNANWSAGGVNFDGSGFGNSQSLYATVGDGLAVTSYVSNIRRIVVPAEGFVRFSYEGAENTYQ